MLGLSDCCSSCGPGDGRRGNEDGSRGHAYVEDPTLGRPVLVQDSGGCLGCMSAVCACGGQQKDTGNEPEARVLEPLIEERIVEVLKEEVHQTFVEVPEVQYLNKVVEVPKRVIQERIVEVPKIVYKERIKEVIKPIYEEKIVEVPDVQNIDRWEETTQTVIQEREVEVPKFIIRQFDETNTIVSHRVKDDGARPDYTTTEKREVITEKREYIPDQNGYEYDNSGPGYQGGHIDIRQNNAAVNHGDQPDGVNPSYQQGITYSGGIPQHENVQTRYTHTVQHTGGQPNYEQQMAQGIYDHQTGQGLYQQQQNGQNIYQNGVDSQPGSVTRTIQQDTTINHYNQGNKAEQQAVYEKVVNVPHIQHAYRNVMTPTYRHVPKPVEVPMTHYRPIPIEKIVDRNVPVPVELHLIQEYLCAKIEPFYKDVHVPVHVQRTIEHPVPREAMKSEHLLPLYYQGTVQDTGAQYQMANDQQQQQSAFCYPFPGLCGGQQSQEPLPKGTTPAPIFHGEAGPIHIGDQQAQTIPMDPSSPFLGAGASNIELDPNDPAVIDAQRHMEANMPPQMQQINNAQYNQHQSPRQSPLPVN